MTAFRHILQVHVARGRDFAGCAEGVCVLRGQAAAAAMLQQAQGGQSNGVPYNLNAFHQRLLAAARQGPPPAGGGPMHGQMPGLGFRPQEPQAAALAGLAGQMQPPHYNQQVYFSAAMLPLTLPRKLLQSQPKSLGRNL